MKIYQVGGSVRDELLGHEAHDLDYVVTGATEKDMLDLGYKSVGAFFPVFLHPETGDEYALARKDKKVAPGYHGFVSTFDTSITLEDDLERRDLTVNAIAKDIGTGEIIDPFNGVQDLRNKVIRHVSEAFKEDPLRVVRVARFFARWDDFTVHPDTLEMMKHIVDSGEMFHISYERYWAEMDKMFRQSNTPFKFFKLLNDVGVLEKVSFFKNIFCNSFNSVQNVKFIEKILNTISAKVDKDKQCEFFIALCAAQDANLETPVIPTHAKKLFGFIQMARAVCGEMYYNEHIFHLLQKCRAFSSDSVIAKDFINALRIAETVGEIFPIDAYTFERCSVLCSNIDIREFVNLKPAEIGYAIKSKRIKIIDDVLKGA